MQGLNLTPLHGHTALCGVYGLLGIGALVLAWFVFRLWVGPREKRIVAVPEKA